MLVPFIISLQSYDRTFFGCVTPAILQTWNNCYDRSYINHGVCFLREIMVNVDHDFVSNIFER